MLQQYQQDKGSLKMYKTTVLVVVLIGVLMYHCADCEKDCLDIGEVSFSKGLTT